MLHQLAGAPGLGLALQTRAWRGLRLLGTAGSVGSEGGRMCVGWKDGRMEGNIGK